MTCIFNRPSAPGMPRVLSRVMWVFALVVCNATRTRSEPDAPGGFWKGINPFKVWDGFNCDDITHNFGTDTQFAKVGGHLCVNVERWYGGQTRCISSSRDFAVGTEEWAYCVSRCMPAAAKKFGLVTFAQKSEQFHVGVNAWLMTKLKEHNAPFSAACEASRTKTAEQFDGYIVPQDTQNLLAACKESCPHKRSQLGPALPSSEGCTLQPGQVSITAIQSVMGFNNAAWREMTTSTTICQWCSSASGTCAVRSEMRYPSKSIATVTDVVDASASVWNGFVFHTSVQTMDLVKQTWDEFQLQPFETRLAKVARQTTSCDTLPETDEMGVSTSCLHNKGALTGRVCDYKDHCFSQQDVFGPGSTDTSFAIRSHSDIVSRVQWYKTLDLCNEDTVNSAAALPIAGYSFFKDSNRQMFFKLHMGDCDKCSQPEHGEVAHSANSPLIGSGIVVCEQCNPKLDEVKEMHNRIVCSAVIPYTTCVACPRHALRDPFTQTCLPCSTFQNPALGSHRTVATDDFCSNCPASEVWSGAQQTCVSIPSSPFEQGSGKLVRSEITVDHYKYSEYSHLAVPSDHYRNTMYEASPCMCTTVHKYAHLCAGYSTDDAYVRNMETNEVAQLSTLTTLTVADANNPELYSYMRLGLCKWCTACAIGEFNEDCVKGSPGQCQTCKTGLSCAADRYLSHEHHLGCEQTRARTNYECTKCKTLVRVGNDFMLAIGCGTTILTRWDPDALSLLGDLQTATCDYSVDAQQTAACRHAQEVLLRAPKGSHSRLIPYCPPSWYFSCEKRVSDGDLADDDAYDATCCKKCVECLGEQKTGPDWLACNGTTASDTQGAYCDERCENNMYESQNKCVYCETCRAGEIF